MEIHFRDLVLVLGVLILLPGMLGAAETRVVFTAETAHILSGKAMRLTNYVTDSAGPTFGKRVLEIVQSTHEEVVGIKVDAAPPGEKPLHGEVTYTVDIPQPGVYYLWARVYWPNDVGHDFLLQVQGYPARLIGNDGTYYALHWVALYDTSSRALFPLKLEKGPRTITLAGRGYGARVDEFLLTTDLDKRPAGMHKPGVSVAKHAPTIVFEAESGKISGQGFRVVKYCKDPGGKVSGNKILCFTSRQPLEIRAVVNDPVTDATARCRVRIPRDGVYYLWARTVWGGEGSNAISVSIPGCLPATRLGGDNTYGALHWVCLRNNTQPQGIVLKQGAIDLDISALSGGVKIDQFLLTSDANCQPAGRYAPDGQ